MGTFTAQILVGRPHPNHGGLDPTHQLFLSENDRPAWILRPLGGEGAEIVWIPTVEHTLEDALLLVACQVLKDDSVARALGGHAERLECYDVPESDRAELYAKCRALNWPCKLIISVFEGSTILSQLPVLSDYGMDIEVCTPRFSRVNSGWTDGARTTGDLGRPVD